MLRYGKNLLFVLFILNTYLFAAQITFTDTQIDAGDVANIEVNLTNEDSIGGFQLQIIDFPNQGYFIDVVVTDRTSAFNVSFNEQDDGSVIIVAFDLTGVGLSSGSGSILELSYQSTGIYTSNIELSLNQGSSVLSDLFGGDSIGQDAHVVMMLQRPNDLYGITDLYCNEDPIGLMAIHVEKNRDGFNDR